MIARRTVVLLSTLTLVTAIGAAAAVIDRASSTRSEVEAEPMYPGFAEQAEQITRIEVQRAPDSEVKSVTLVRTESGWVVEERSGYPASVDPIRKLLFDIGELERIERKTASAERHHRLQLTDVSKEGSASTRIVLKLKDGAALADFHVGKEQSAAAGGKELIYLRPSEADQTWLALGKLELRDGPERWLNRVLAEIPSEAIVETMMDTGEGNVLNLKRKDEKNFDILNLSEKLKVKSQYSVNNAAVVLDRLVFDDVRLAKELTFDPALGKSFFKTKDGVEVVIEFAADPLGDAAEKPEQWMRFSVSIPEGLADDAKGPYEALSERSKGWAFRLTGYETARVRATLESLTEAAE